MVEYQEYHDLENGKKVKFTIYIKDIPRAYSVSCNLIQQQTLSEGYTIDEYTPSEGFGVMLEEIKGRKSAKKLENAKYILKQKTNQYLDWFRVKEGLLDVETYNIKYGDN